MSEISSPVASSAWDSLPDRAWPSNTGWTIGPLNETAPPTAEAVGAGGNTATITYGNGFTEYSATIDGRNVDLRESSDGVALTLADGRQITLPDAKVALEGGSLMIKVNGQTLTLEQAFGQAAFGQGAGSSGEPASGPAPASGSPQPPPGSIQQVPPAPGMGNGTEPTNNQPAPTTPLW